MNNNHMFAKCDQKIVYIKEIALSDLPDDLDIDDLAEGPVFALHDADGAQLALAANRQVAVHLAHANDLVPVNIH